MQTEGLVGGPNPTGMGLRDGDGPPSRVGVAELLEQVLTLGASDLHLTAGAKPTVRVNGRDVMGPPAAWESGCRLDRPTEERVLRALEEAVA